MEQDLIYIMPHNHLNPPRFLQSNQLGFGNRMMQQFLKKKKHQK